LIVDDIMGQKHLNRENVTKVLDVLIYRPSWKNAMAKIGASEGLFYQWMTKSRKAESESDRASELFVEWPAESGIHDWMHNHVGRARSASIALYSAAVMDESLNGREVPVIGPMGTQTYKLNERYLHRDDDFIRLSEGLDAGASVEWYRYEHTPDGRPVPLTRTEFPPATVRIKAIEQDPRFIHREQHTLKVSGHVIVASPLRRLPGEPPVDLPRLRELAALSPEERRRVLNASAVPKDARGLRTIPALPPPINRDQPDDQGHGLRPAAEFDRPPQPTPQQAQPSYARRPASEGFDKSEGTGTGTVPFGGMKVV
jgi:hypothetical protein